MEKIKFHKKSFLACCIVLNAMVFQQVLLADSEGIDSLHVLDTINASVFPMNTASDSANPTRKKADFILDIASQIVLPNSESDSVYIIGIHGKSREIRELYDTLSKISDSLFLSERQIIVTYFRNTRGITPVDLLYLNGESKIRIRDLNKKLEGHPHLIVTENFPFGTSLVNFTINEHSEMQFELQDEALIEQGAVITPEILESPNRIKEEKKWGRILERKEQELEYEKIRSDKQEDIIEEQIDEIVEKEQLISDQQSVINTTSLFITILIVLVMIIIWLLKKRKEALLVVKQKNKDITDSIRYARYIQEAMLTTPNLIAKAFSDSFVMYLPKDIISGDFYWFRETDHIKMLAVADCTGHGVPGAFLSIMGNELLNFYVDSFKILDPPQLLQVIDQRIAQSLNQDSTQRADGMDMAILSFNAEKGTIRYSGAYRPLVMIRNEELAILKPTRSSLGGYSHKQAKDFTLHEFKALPGDCYYMFSDGFPDQFGGQKRKKFMSRRFYNVLQDIHQLPMKEQKDKLLQAHFDWKGSEEQVDDISVVGIRI